MRKDDIPVELNLLTHVEKLKHKFVHKHTLGLLIGVLIMLVAVKLEGASVVARLSAHTMEAFGCLPILKHGEVLWEVFS